MKEINGLSPLEYQRDYKKSVAGRLCGCGRLAVRHNSTGFVCAVCARPANHKVDHRLGAARMNNRVQEMWERHFGPWKQTPGAGFGSWQALCQQLGM